MTDHFIVCGMGQSGYRIVRLLLRLGEKVIVVAQETRVEWQRAIEARDAILVIADARDINTLIEAGLKQAKAIIVATDNDLVNLEIALDVKKANPTLPSVVRIFDQTLARQLEAVFEVRRALSMSEIAAPMFAAEAIGKDSLCTFTVHDQFFIVNQTDIEPEDPDYNLSLADLRLKLNAGVIDHFGDYGATAASNAGKTRDKKALAIGVLPDWRLSVRRSEAGTHEHETTSSSGKTRSRRNRAERHEDPWPKRMITLMRHIWTSTSVTLRIIFVSLMSVIAISVAIFHFAMNLSVADALYFVIATVTTVGYGDITARNQSDALKLYTCLLMILGSSTLVMLYSIITDFLVTARFQQALGKRRQPQSDHFIVVGLGTVGFRIVEKLYQAGAKIIAVNRTEDSEFVESVRAMAPVVIADGRMRETLNRVGVRHAKAVLAVTSDDAANLGIVLEAKQINKDVRTVARLFEPELAEKVKSQLNIDAAMGAFFISAPTFVASALYTDVKHAFVKDNVMYTILHRQVRDEWHGKTPELIQKELKIEVLLCTHHSEKAYKAVRPDEELHKDQWMLAITKRELVA